jgi:hypothetical protein
MIKMAEIVSVLKEQIGKLNLVIEGLEDNSKLSYPTEYDLGKILIKEVVQDLKRVDGKLSDRAFQSWLSSRL